ncbi:MAG: 2-hydroxyglutaryl-CoA dehydratase [Firmicutes bacterium]|nr:2-hydroxyglutaryl-CoA dehydratase [Candidatus Fermentithermobacillaceae bacterium]
MGQSKDDILVVDAVSDRFLGVDLGSVTTKIVLIDGTGDIVYEDYLRNEGGPLHAIQSGFGNLLRGGYIDSIKMVGTTGSGRELAAVIVGADTVKNEISSHARAASLAYPDVGTVIDIGGQDSKIIFFKNGYPIGFNMNTVCAAGTGSFLDHQANRLGISIESFGDLALKAEAPARIAGRCGVFAESDLIHKQQLGFGIENLVAGLCLALATNYVTNVARGQPIRPRVLFQGGVAANSGMLWALEKKIGLDITVPPHFKVMGAWGAALFAREKYYESRQQTRFRQVEHIASLKAVTRGFICEDCANSCEIQEIFIDDALCARWGSKCGKWDDLSVPWRPKKGSAAVPVKVV